MNQATASAVGMMLAVTVVLAGCSKAGKTEADKTQAALGDAIVVDPTMTAESGAAGAEKGIVLSPDSRSSQAIEATRKAAADLAGGLRELPEPVKGSASQLSAVAAAAAQTTPAAKAAKTDCTTKVQYGPDWAQKLPAELPLYPRAAVQEAAGTDSDGCALRVVSFGTPVAQQDVIGFYRAMALKAGYSADYRLDGGDQVVGGGKGGQAYVVFARKQSNGVTEVDLITSGR
ncbi:hypothetical protein WBP06_17960 [Novosphingobium sp. BL-8H]|uniref:hypothetical protein n=1 Tax=Novosphingobium sp. BL-8H TaxID=3127640 RepID=UPI0037574707